MLRMAFIDVEGTLTKFEFWEEIANYVEVGEEIRSLLYRGLAGEVDWFESFKKRVELIKGVDKETVLRTSQKLVLPTQARELVKILKNEGFFVVLVSGCFREVLKKSLTYTNADILVSNKLIFKNGKVYGAYMPVRNKGEVIDRFLTERSFVLAIGDGGNDIPMFEKADVSIAVGNNRKAIEYADFNAKDLDDAIKIVQKVLENDMKIGKGCTHYQEALETV
ncbi:HAD family hydrolase [Palaeococcus sp. (in: euryarchaeotes)]